MISPQTMLHNMMDYLHNIAETVAGGKVTVDLSDADITQLAGAMAANPLTDAQLRATPVPVSAAVLGATTDVPVDDVEAATARGVISLLKGIKNYLKTLAAAVTNNKVQVDVATSPAVTGTVSAEITKWGAKSVITPGVDGGVAVGGPTAADAAIVANPLTVGARGSAATPPAVSADGDVTNLWTDLYGRLHVVGDSITGSVAHDAADANNPVKIGGKANAAVPAAVQEGDRADASFDLFGQLRILDTRAPHNLVPNSTQADQALTVDATAGGVQFGALHADTSHVFWDCQTAQCRVTFDNSAPTATNGHVIEAGDSGVWPKALAVAAKFIRTGATSAVIAASQLKGA